MPKSTISGLYGKSIFSSKSKCPIVTDFPKLVSKQGSPCLQQNETDLSSEAKERSPLPPHLRHGMWDLSSLTRDQRSAAASCSGSMDF